MTTPALSDLVCFTCQDTYDFGVTHLQPQKAACSLLVSRRPAQIVEQIGHTVRHTRQTRKCQERLDLWLLARRRVSPHLESGVPGQKAALQAGLGVEIQGAARSIGMPRPVATEKTELPDEQQWFLTALDMKFRQQETVIRALLLY